MLLGRSEQGRPIRAWEIGDPRSTRKVLVVGCIHGNEPAGIAIADALGKASAELHSDLWVVPDLNPDGVAADTRQNARGVDLNRNFPWHWRPLGPPGTTFYAGAGALSEREARIAYRLIRRLRPAVSIWFHQHLDVVDVSGGNTATERRFARRVGMRLERLPRYPGSVTSWENTILPRGAAFVVELPAGPVPAARVGVFTSAIRALEQGP